MPNMLDPTIRKRFTQVIEAVVEHSDLNYRSLSLRAGLGETYVRDVIKRGRGKESEIRRVLDNVGDGLGDYVILNRGSFDPALMMALRNFTRLRFGGTASPDRFRATVVGRVGAGAVIQPEFEQLGDDGLFEIETSVAVLPDSIAFEVQGDSMWPRYEDGDILICRKEGADHNILNAEAIVRTADGKRYVKKVRRGTKPGLFILQSHNAEPIVDVQLEWASEVEQIIRAKRRRKIA